MRIAVTGGNGDLGRSLTPYLIDEGHTVVSIDRALPPALGPSTAGGVAYLVADVTDYGDVGATLSGCDAVVHLAAHRSPLTRPAPTVFTDNVSGSYNVLHAAATLGIERVCLASSINAIGGVFSRAPVYDYFPLDEQHPTFAEDPYSLSKWVLEQTADATARRHETMRIASLRFHWLVESREWIVGRTAANMAMAQRHLWAYTLLAEAARACLLALTAEFSGHEAFYIVAPRTAVSQSSRDLAREHYPDVPLRTELDGSSSFFSCRKAEQLLGWRHREE